MNTENKYRDDDIDVLLEQTYKKILKESKPIDDEIQKVFSENILDLF